MSNQLATPWLRGDPGRDQELLQSYSAQQVNKARIGAKAAVTSNWYWRGVRGTDEKKPFEEHGYVVDIWRRDGRSWRVVSRSTVVLPGNEERLG